ncbi:MAG: hypothetical protein LBI71_12805 [Enterobacteriaceae bacterium]|jgi:uncharacterized protein YxeA|nr:hypothetical protein [Enterobacteriaceae bacterium]
MKKILLVIIALFTIGSVGGIILAGMNMYNRSIAADKAFKQDQEQQKQIQQESAPNDPPNNPQTGQ